MVRMMVAAMALAFCAPSLHADELVLKDGRRLEGRLVGTDDGVVVFERSYGLLRVPEERVERIVESPDVFDGIVAGLATAGDDVEQLLALARRAEELGLSRRTREIARRIVELDDDHAGARQLLGQIRHEGRWMSETRARRLRGEVRRDGRWLSADEAREEARRRRELRRLETLERKAERLAAALYAPSARESERAYLALLEMSEKERIPSLRPIAARLYRDAEALRARPQRSATVTVRAQSATLTNLRERTLNLGTGRGARVQLPELRRISIGTTVSVPLR